MSIQTWAVRWEAFIKENEFCFDVKDHLTMHGAYMPHVKWDRGWKPKDRHDEEESLACFSICDGGLGNWIPVVMKRVPTTSNELHIASYFGSEPSMRAVPDNHCVPIYQVMDGLPGYEDSRILVMPQLRPCDELPFATVAEVVEFLRQIFEGVQFLHRHFVAHRLTALDQKAVDVKYHDGSRAMYTEDFHPVQVNKSLDLKRQVRHRRTRTECHPRYFIIDFGSTRSYDPRKGLPEASFDDRVAEGLPEYRRRDACPTYNPFPADVYQLGKLIHDGFLIRPGSSSLDFLRPLVDTMMKEVPCRRPSIGQAKVHFDELVHALTTFHLRSPVERSSILKHFKAQLSCALKRVPSLGSQRPGVAMEPLPEELRSFFTMTATEADSLDTAWRNRVDAHHVVPEKYTFDHMNVSFYRT
ncbi:hypothetical protein VNI00_016289 [Paramarasmius palmivorus]|uniref:Protein kinase domain-containing protein n=1 Tax=Paramarasmius palmivorus TaxID=297713 RepID=A0AAW0BE70_9AGAR